MGGTDPAIFPHIRLDRDSRNTPQALDRSTLLVGLAHPDDEVAAAGTILAQRARGDRVVIVWLTKGEQTEAFGPLPTQEVARRREAQGHAAGELLGAETIFFDLPDTGLRHDRETVLRIARLFCELRPEGLITWGDAWVRGMRHPDHQVCGQLFRDAILLARIAKVVAPLEPHRAPMPVFTLRDVHSILPAVGVDVSPYREHLDRLANHYHRGIGFGDPAWLDARLRAAGERWGFRYAEEFDAWESPSGAVTSLLPAAPLPGVPHPERSSSP